MCDYLDITAGDSLTMGMSALNSSKTFFRICKNQVLNRYRTFMLSQRDYSGDEPLYSLVFGHTAYTVSLHSAAFVFSVNSTRFTNSSLIIYFDPRPYNGLTGDFAVSSNFFLVKSSDRDIGLKGKKQMVLYAKIVNPLKSKNRSELSRLMRNMSQEYNSLITQHEALDRAYKVKTQQAIKALKDFIIDWRTQNPDADSRSLYDVPEFDRLYNAEDTLSDEWTAQADELTTKAKKAMTEALKSKGYDGVILESDEGSFGRSTDAYIALYAEQIKSATDNIGTFDPNNPDIRYSAEPMTLKQLEAENKKLKKQLEYWRNQTRKNPKKTVREGDVKKLAKAALRCPFFVPLWGNSQKSKIFD